MEFSRKLKKCMKISLHMGPHALNNLEPKSGRKGDLPKIHTANVTLDKNEKLGERVCFFNKSVDFFFLLFVFFSGISISMRECDYLEYVLK